jgi:hypothetical protein
VGRGDGGALWNSERVYQYSCQLQSTDSVLTTADFTSYSTPALSNSRIRSHSDVVLPPASFHHDLAHLRDLVAQDGGALELQLLPPASSASPARDDLSQLGLGQVGGSDVSRPSTRRWPGVPSPRAISRWAVSSSVRRGRP